MSSGSTSIGEFFSLLWDYIFLPHGFYWMPDIVHLTALDIGHFIFLLSILELALGCRMILSGVDIRITSVALELRLWGWVGAGGA